MGMKIIFFTLFAFLLIENSSSTSPAILQLGLNVIISQIKQANITIPNVPLIMPDFLQDVIVGYINLTNLHVYGLDTLETQSAVEGLTTDRKKFNKNNITITGILDNIGIEAEYNLDMGLLDIVPLYGVGTLNIGFKKLDFYINTILYDYLIFHNASLVNLNIESTMRHSNMTSITGFWVNEEVSSFLTKLLNLLEATFCMWYNYNNACIDCILSNVLQIIINLLLKAQTESRIPCDCFGEATVLQNLHLENLTSAWMIGDYKYIKEEITTNEAFKQLYERVYDIVMITIKENDLRV